MTNDLSLDDILLHRGDESAEVVNVDGNRVKLVIFSLGSEWYALYGKNITEILPEDTLVFFVPGCPPSLPGVINLRGTIESVLHLGMVLKLSDNIESAKTILLAKAENIRSGLCVNAVIDVIDVLESDIKPVADSLPENLQDYVLGALVFSSKAVTLLNLEKILTDYQQGLG